MKRTLAVSLSEFSNSYKVYARMAPQNNINPVYKRSAIDFRNEILAPMIINNQTNKLKSFDRNVISPLTINTSSHMNNSLIRQNHTTNSGLNFPKQEETEQGASYLLHSSLNIWLTHGL